MMITKLFLLVVLLGFFCIILLHIGLFVDKRAGDDPEFKIAEHFSTMPRDEVYDQSVRISSALVKKMQAYGYDKADYDAKNFFME